MEARDGIVENQPVRPINKFNVCEAGPAGLVDQELALCQECFDEDGIQVFEDAAEGDHPSNLMGGGVHGVLTPKDASRGIQAFKENA